MGQPFGGERSHLSHEIFGQRRHPYLMSWRLEERRSAALVVEVEGRQTKAVAVVEGALGQKTAVGFWRTSGRSGPGGGLLVDQCRFGCSRLRLTDNAVLRMQSDT